MIPRNVLVHRMFFLCSAFVALAYAAPAQFKLTKGYCASTQDEPAVYVTNFFDLDVKAFSISTAPLNNAFKNFLVEKYNFKSNAGYPTQCSLFENLSKAQESKQQLVGQVQQLRKQVVEVNWNPGPLATTSERGGDSVAIGPSGPAQTHTFCAVGNQSTMYFSAVFDTFGPTLDPKLNDGFSEFLSKTYGFTPEVDSTCTVQNTVREAEDTLKARIAGVRYNRRKAVETGWKFDPTGTYKPAPKPAPKVDDDPEPVQKTTATPPQSKNIQDFAAKEMSGVLANCQNDRIMSGAFDCYAVQRAVYNYRIGHASDATPEPLAALLDKLKCDECIGQFVKAWARSTAMSRGLKPEAADCVAERFPTALHAKPNPNSAAQMFDDAITACRK